MYKLGNEILMYSYTRTGIVQVKILDEAIVPDISGYRLTCKLPESVIVWSSYNFLKIANGPKLKSKIGCCDEKQHLCERN